MVEKVKELTSSVDDWVNIAEFVGDGRMPFVLRLELDGAKLTSIDFYSKSAAMITSKYVASSSSSEFVFDYELKNGETYYLKFNAERVVGEIGVTIE